jgi:superfamily II DNA or RNA helicase
MRASQKRVKRRPGASPLLFGKFLMDFAAFLSLEDITEALPAYREEVLAVEMDGPLREAYEKLEEDIREALKAYRGNQSVLSVSMNALLLYPDKPFGLGNLTAFGYNPETQERERILISSPPDLDAHIAYAKERRLVKEVKSEVNQGRRCQIFAVFTLKHDVTQRLKALLSREGIRAEVLTADVPPERREARYEKKPRGGMQACIAHPKLVMTGLDYVESWPRCRRGLLPFETRALFADLSISDSAGANQ